MNHDPLSQSTSDGDEPINREASLSELEAALQRDEPKTVETPVTPTPKQPSKEGSSLELLRQKVLEESTHKTAVPVPSTPPPQPKTSEPAPQPVPVEPQQAAAATPITPVTPSPAQPVQPKEDPANTSSVRSIRTLKDDVASLVAKQRISVMSAVAAEEDRRTQVRAEESKKEVLKKSYLPLIISGALLLLGLGVIVTAFMFLKNDEGILPVTEVPSFIFADERVQIDVTNKRGGEIRTYLTAAKAEQNIRVGAITQLYITTTSPNDKGTSAESLVSSQDFLTQIDANVTPSFLRSLSEQFMVGVHQFDGNQPFIILKTIFYENTFAGMLDWEKSMQADLSPFFGPAIALLPPIEEPIVPEPAVSTTSSSTDTTATSSTSTPNTPGSPEVTTGSLQPLAFTDQLVRNKEARVLRDREGNIVLLYAFIDQETLVITTNEYTFQEILTRFASRRY